MKKGFTIIELIISISIIMILSTMWFVSYINNISDARDSERKTDISLISSSLKLYKQRRGLYPTSWDYFNVTNSWKVVAMQWFLNTSVALSTLDEVPLDPYLEIPYFYSTTSNKQEFQVALSVENQWDYKALLKWDYKTVSINVLPTILLAIKSSTWVEIHDGVWSWSTYRKSFIFDEWSYNLPYVFDWNRDPYSSAESFSAALNDENISFWQNTDYRTCDEIYDAAKAIHTWYEEEYQFLDNSWALVSSGCTF